MVVEPPNRGTAGGETPLSNTWEGSLHRHSSRHMAGTGGRQRWWWSVWDFSSNCFHFQRNRTWGHELSMKTWRRWWRCCGEEKAGERMDWAIWSNCQPPKDPLQELGLAFKNKIMYCLVWLSGLSVGLQTKALPVWFPVRAHAWVAGQVPSWGCMRGNHILTFLFLSFSLLSLLSKIK